MSGLRRNIVVNYLGQAWVSIMGLAFLPVYIRYLGVESYGLIGLFGVIQAWLTLLDLGMTPTLNREMARFTAGAHTAQSINNLLRSLEMVCFGIAVLIAGAVWGASGWLASDWLKAEKMPVEVVSQALSIMAFVVALRFVEGMYRGSLFGLQQQVWYNAASAILATIRQLGAFALLVWVSPTIQVFFIWQAVFSLITVLVFAIAVHRMLPRPSARPRFSRTAIADVWKFAGGMLGITFLAILLTQIDKVLLSRLLTLDMFGYYTLAASVTSILSMVTGPITQALYPRMVELHARDDYSSLATIYHKGAQLVSICTAPLTVMLMLYSHEILFMWTGSAEIAANTAPILAVLAGGTFLNTLMHTPGSLQLAFGWTSLGIKTNLVAVVVLVPAILWVVPRFGAVGAAWMWVLLNSGYVLISMQFMHHRILAAEKWTWYFSDVLAPFFAALAGALLMGLLRPDSYQDRGHTFVYLAAVGSVSLAASCLFSNRIRPQLRTLLQSLLSKYGRKVPHV
jgi:O-antigen/teichoic acid export membrane protein